MESIIQSVRVAVLIPAHDEEASLPLVLGSIPKDLVDEVVVVDNGSGDRTAAVARAHGATLLEERRRGYGAGCRPLRGPFATRGRSGASEATGRSMGRWRAGRKTPWAFSRGLP